VSTHLSCGLVGNPGHEETAVTILLGTLAVFLVSLVYERVSVDRLRKSIPLVIAVTGTRGKSTVVRLLASILRESGRTVLAKSTGSQAQYVLPDGTAENISRRGIVSVLEQKNTLQKATRLRVDCLVVEIMSIRPENHFVESHRLLKPDIVLLTNVRRDHTEAMGEREEEIAEVLQHDFVPGARVFVPHGYEKYVDTGTIQTNSLQLSVVSGGKVGSSTETSSVQSQHEFSENLDLVTFVARSLNVDDAVIERGIQNTVYDIGRFRIWTVELSGKRVFAVNAFAANDPESTMMVLKKTRENLGITSARITGLLSLRADRPDRTEQWITALGSGMSEEFSRLFVLGGHAHAVRRKIKSMQVLETKSPEVVTQLIADAIEKDGIIFGFGNIGGAGEGLIEYWQREGKEYGV
jgi:poly-gamma-glutamate synthase PgsB/CapB